MPADKVLAEPTLDERDHLRGCPASRTEQYEQISPAGETVTVTRCIDCGGQNTTRSQ